MSRRRQPEPRRLPGKQNHGGFTEIYGEGQSADDADGRRWVIRPTGDPTDLPPLLDKEGDREWSSRDPRGNNKTTEVSRRSTEKDDPQMTPMAADGSSGQPETRQTYPPSLIRRGTGSGRHGIHEEITKPQRHGDPRRMKTNHGGFTEIYRGKNEPRGSNQLRSKKVFSPWISPPCLRGSRIRCSVV